MIAHVPRDITKPIRSNTNKNHVRARDESTKRPLVYKHEENGSVLIPKLHCTTGKRNDVGIIIAVKCVPPPDGAGVREYLQFRLRVR